ncbi:BCCT family transporter [Dyella sp. C9]|uniref:BCCT family transporter n=1 Tax=Dyella sp. C9 TaxID=2202154 RepID=UPI000DEEDA4A|nr:BCCT family transporter [Dyella sp. C9]
MVAGRSHPRTTLKAPIVWPSLLVLGGLLALCAIRPTLADRWFSGAQAWVVERFDWFYVMAVAAFLLFLVLIACSRFGNIKLGPDDAEPEFSFISWTAMLFAAGMGIGLMYFGVGEPMQHYVAPPTATGSTPQAAQQAMLMTFFHWGFSAWAIYGVMGLVLAYFGFRYHLPLTLRSGLYPVLRDRVHGWIGHSVDAFALVGTVAGIATTLGYGVLQLSAGLHTVGDWDTSGEGFRITLIVVVIMLAGASAASGLDKGVRILSEINLLLAVSLMVFVLLAGPTSYLLSALGDNIGNYLSHLAQLSLHTYAYEPTREPSWFGDWTIQYWAWWISWSPFVGMFIARISRGRTIRQFVTGVLLVPTAFNLVWMTVFGDTAIWLDTHRAAGALAQTAANVDDLLFRFFDYLPLSKLLSLVAIVLVAVFFITSADSGAFVIDTIATRGAPRSPVWQRLFWAGVLGLTAALLLAAGGLKALQALTLVAALPVAAIMLALCYGLWQGLKADQAHSMQEVGAATSYWTGEHWRLRLSRIVRETSEQEARQFLRGTVLSALAKVAAELSRAGIEARTEDGDDEVRIIVPSVSLREFAYGARVVRKRSPYFLLRESVESDQEHLYRVVTFFADARSGYDISHLREQEIIADALRQYERYLSLAGDEKTHLLSRSRGRPTET